MPDNKMFVCSKLKAFVDDKMTPDNMFISFFDRVENIVRKAENDGFQNFSLFSQSFKTAL